MFLGILLDGERQVLAVPEDKREHALNLLSRFRSKKKATVKDLQNLAGLLNFLTRAIHLGRAFTRRMHAKFSGLVETLTNLMKNGAEKHINKILKPYHHVHLDKEFRDDCLVWESFLLEGLKSVCRPFVDVDRFTHADELFFYTDSSTNPDLGMGGIFGRQWFFAQWDPTLMCQKTPSITYLELFALCMGVHIWSECLKNLRCIIFCDNQATVEMINQTTSKCKNCMFLIRKLTLKSLSWNVRVFV